MTRPKRTLPPRRLMTNARWSAPGELHPEPLYHLRVTPPLRPHLHDELEEQRVPDEALDLGPRARADLPHHRALLPHEDPLQRLRFDENHRAQHLLRPVLDDDRDRVRHLVAGEMERLLTDHLCDPVLERHVGRL